MKLVNIQKYSPFSNLHTTKLKITIGKILYFIIVELLGKGNKKIIIRDEIRYEVDLTEGIDLSLYVFGNFQKHIVDKTFHLPKNAISLDVGANFGIISLQIAKNTPNGQLFAFEPTHYAYKKLLKNLSLNPKLSKRITPIQAFVSEKSKSNPKITAYSSWKVGGNSSQKKHPIHAGTAKATHGIEAISLDDFCMHKKIKRVDFIKIDTDGHEYEVLKGALKTIKVFKPIIVFEVGDYMLRERSLDFSYFIDYFSKIPGYSLYSAQSNSPITRKNYQSIIPKFGSIDVLAICKDKLSSKSLYNRLFLLF